MILCAGEALIDMLPRTTRDGEQAFAPYPGGAVFNTAVALARLGVPTGLFTGLSTDLFGERLAAALTANGVDHALASRSARPTTLAFVSLVDGQAEYAFYDENTAGRMLAESDLPEVPANVSALFFGGISLAVEPCGEVYAALATRTAQDRLVMLDPNIRPGFIADEARYRARLDRILSVTDVVKVSDEDLRWLMGPGEIAELAAGFRARGPSLVLVTRGAEGVVAYGPGVAATSVPAERVEVVDTVGAGDTFNGGFLAGLADAGLLDKARLRAGLPEQAVRDALTLGVRAAAVTVSRAGANPPRREDLA
jgi:fructokinase